MGLFDFLSGNSGGGGTDPNAGSSGGLLGGFGGFLHDNSQGLLGMSSGLLNGQGWGQGLSQGFQGFAQGNARDQAGIKKRKSDAATQQLLATMPNVTPQQRAALANNDALSTAVAAQGMTQQMRPDEYATRTKEADAQGLTGAARGRYILTGDLAQNQAPQVIEYYDAQGRKQKGYMGNDGQPVPIGGPEKADDANRQPPQGYAWGPPDQNGQPTLQAIPGGPAGKLDSGDAAKVSLANDFLKQAPDIRQKIASGALSSRSGIFSDPLPKVFDTATGHGEQGEIQRAIQGGQEALVRGLTGAGMSNEEAQRNAAQYSPSMMDTPDDMLSKFDGLTRKLQGMGQALGQGRGGSPLAGGQSQQGGWQAPNGAVVRRVGQ